MAWALFISFLSFSIFVILYVIGGKKIQHQTKLNQVKSTPGKGERNKPANAGRMEIVGNNINTRSRMKEKERM
jgi:hypothetical protein